MKNKESRKFRKYKAAKASERGVDYFMQTTKPAALKWRRYIKKRLAMARYKVAVADGAMFDAPLTSGKAKRADNNRLRAKGKRASAVTIYRYS